MAFAYYNFLVNEIFEKKFFKISEEYLKGNMIDIGCGSKPYENKLRKYVSTHTGVDHVNTDHDRGKIDLFASAYSIPVESNSYDSAICTAVLEHLEEPECALRECYRVIKPGAYAIYSVPLIWHIHEKPRDFYRFTSYSIEYLLKKVGFEVVEIIPLSGFLTTFTQLFIYFILRYNKGILRLLGLVNVLVYVLQKIALALNKYDKSYDWTWMYIVVAKKPNPAINIK